MRKLDISNVVIFFILLFITHPTFAQTELTVTLSASKDNTIWELLPEYEESSSSVRSNGAGENLFVGKSLGGEVYARIMRALMQFSLDGIPAGATITSASLELYMNRTNTNSSGPMTTSLYSLTQDWGEGTSNAGGTPEEGGGGGGTSASLGDATWLHTFFDPKLPDDENSLWTNWGGDFNSTASASTVVDSVGPYTWESDGMIENIKYWLENPDENFGWILRGDESGELSPKRFTSRNASDGGGPELTVKYLNQLPVAVNDTAFVNEDDTDGVNVNILTNDYDPDGNIVGPTVNIVNGPFNGTYSLFRGIVNYVPDPDFYGEDYIQYTVDDNIGDASNVAQVLINVHPINDAPIAVNDTVTTNEDQDIVINILSNDIDDSGFDFSSITITDGPSGGSITNINESTGEVTYSPADNTFGIFSFSYQVDDDSSVTSNEASVTIFVNSVNDIPITENDNGEVNEDEATTIDILDNDADSDGFLIVSSILITSNPEHGTVTNINTTTGVASYEPYDNYFGEDAFSYTIEDDSEAVSNESTVNIIINSVNDEPTAGNDQANTSEDTAVVINVVDNDNDIDGNLNFASINIVTVPAHGSITNINTETGFVTYMPDNGYNGDDSFIYTIADDSAAISNQATVNISIGSVNDFPITEGDEAETNEDIPVDIDILFNDQDTDGSLIASTILIISNPEHGTVTNINTTTGVATYQPTGDYFGDDAFRYTVEDDSGAISMETSVSITIHSINDAPVANNDSTETEEEDATLIDVLDNDTDVDGSINELSIDIVSDALHGAINVDEGDGSLLYTPDKDFFGGDSFTYTVQDDSSSTSNEATVYVTVTPINDSPVISGIPQQSFNEDDSLIISFTSLASFVNDPDNPDSTLLITFTEGTHISAQLTSEIVKIKAPHNWFGMDSMKVSVSDGEFSDSTIVLFYVHPVNDVPMFKDLPEKIEFANTDSSTIDFDSIVDDFDLPNDSLRWAFSTNVNSLLFEFSPTTNVLTLTAPNFAGSAVLYLTVTDDSSAFAMDSIAVQISGDVTGIDDLANAIPKKFDLYQNFPNPFNPSTRIKFDLPKAEFVRINVYNVRGQRVQEIINRNMPAGKHQIEFRAQHFSSGIYFYTIEAGSFHKVKKMILIK